MSSEERLLKSKVKKSNTLGSKPKKLIKGSSLSSMLKKDKSTKDTSNTVKLEEYDLPQLDKIRLVKTTTELNTLFILSLQNNTKKKMILKNQT